MKLKKLKAVLIMLSSVNTIFYIAILLMSVVVHEVAHGVAALHFGDETAKLQGRLTLNPLKHLDMFGSILLPLMLIIIKSPFLFGWAKPVPYNPANLRNQRLGTFVVAAAGIVTNFCVAIVFSIGARMIPLAYDVKRSIVAATLTANNTALSMQLAGGAAPKAFYILTLIVFVNVLLGIFNLVPIPPLDGSKILFSAFPYRLRRLEGRLERYTFPILIIFILFLWKYITPLIIIVFTNLIGIF